LPLARAHQDGTEGEEYDGRAEEGGEVGIDALDANLAKITIRSAKVAESIAHNRQGHNNHITPHFNLE
jgi:hypothetical protein